MMLNLGGWMGLDVAGQAEPVWESPTGLDVAIQAERVVERLMGLDLAIQAALGRVTQ
jgi:hypothetical protein